MELKDKNKIPTQEEVKANVAKIPTLDTETLAHTYKVYLSKQDKLLLTAIKPLTEAIMKELRSRTKSTIKEDTEQGEQYE